MARGWESKAVEEQQAQAAVASESRQRLTTEQTARKQRAETLALCRKRVLQQLLATQNLAYRRSLELALADLEQQLARLV